MSTLQPLETALLRTLAYFDVFDYPLTGDELWRWVYPERRGQAAAKADVEAALSALRRHGRVGESQGYFMLPGREAIAATRQQRGELSKKKWERAKSTARFLELVPFVKMVAVVNTLAINNSRDESDIDFLILTSPNHIWISRLIVTGIVSLLGNRRHGTNIRNRVCLSFYATTKAMDFDQLKLDDNDHHFAFWSSQVVPLVDDGAYERFAATNGWVRERLPNGFSWDWTTRLLPPNPVLRGVKRFYEFFFSTWIGQYLETYARDAQLKRMNANTNSKSKLGTTEVVISEDVLKFHEDDRRRRYNLAYELRLERLGIGE